MPLPTSGSRLAHHVPVPRFIRFLFVAVGTFILIMTPWELWRGVWPINLTSPFFALIILGAWAVGFPLALAGLLGRSVTWEIDTDSITINANNPFSKYTFHYGPANILALEVVEHSWMEGPNTWFVALSTSDGHKHQSREFEEQADAEAFKADIEKLVTILAPAKKNA